LLPADAVDSAGASSACAVWKGEGNFAARVAKGSRLSVAQAAVGANKAKAPPSAEAIRQI
jgi:hypothetical protein